MARDLKVLTRKDGVRAENPLMRADDKYYLMPEQRTPALRKEADELEPPKKDSKYKNAAKARR